MNVRRLKQELLVALIISLSLLIGATQTEDSNRRAQEELTRLGIPSIVASVQGAPLAGVGADEQEALIKEYMENRWRYEDATATEQPLAPTPPAVPPAANGLLVYVNEGGHLAQTAADGSKSEPLTTAVENVQSPQWSPNEDIVSFVGDKQGSDGRCLYTLVFDTKQLTTVTCETLEVFDPHWSPDGHHLTFYGRKVEADTKIRGWVVSAAGGGLSEIAPGLLNVWTPKFMDDNIVIFSGEVAGDEWRIYAAYLDNLGVAISLTRAFTCACTAGSIVAGQPVYSAASREIAFAAARTEEGKSSRFAVLGVYTIEEIDPNNLDQNHKLNELGDVADTRGTGVAGYGHLYWSPDSEKLGMLATGTDFIMRLNVLGLGGNDVSTLHSREGGEWSEWDWSPDGRLIATGHQRPEGPWEVNTIYVGSDSFQRLLFGHSPTWRKATEAQCAGVDKSNRPVMIVTGWGGSDANGLGHDDQLKRFIEYMADKGYKEDCNLFYATGTSPHKFLLENGLIIRDNICRAYNLAALFDENEARTFDIIGYSYGGLRARYFLETSWLYDGVKGVQCDNGVNIHVENLITLGTPHGGEPFPITGLPTDLLPFSAFIGLCDGGLDLCHLLHYDGEPIALFEMLPGTRLAENLLHSQPAGTCYHILAGDAFRQVGKAPPGLLVILLASRILALAPNDFAVHRASSYVLDTLPLNILYPRTDTIDTFDVHGYVPELEWWSGPHDLISFVEPADTFNTKIAPLIGKPCVDNRSEEERNVDIDLAQATASLRTPTTTAATPQRDLVFGALVPNEPATGQFKVTEAGDSHVTVYWNNGDLDFSLTDPQGTIVAPTLDGNDPNYFELEIGFGHMADFNLTGMTPGTWSYSLTVSDTEVGVPYRLLYAAPRPISVSLTGPQYLKAGEPLTLSATVAIDETPLAGATVTARIERPDLTVVTVTLLDDGVHDDGPANDGVYGNAYTNTNLGGFYGVVVTAVGDYENVDYQRTTSRLVSVAPASGLLGSYSDVALDLDGDTFYEGLVFTADADIGQPGDYLLQAELWAGARLITRAEEVRTLEAGEQPLTVLFDGDDIRDGGLDGPYTIRNMMFVDQTQASILIDAQDFVHETWYYDHRQFGTPMRQYLPMVHNR